MNKKDGKSNDDSENIRFQTTEKKLINGKNPNRPISIATAHIIVKISLHFWCPLEEMGFYSKYHVNN